MSVTLEQFALKVAERVRDRIKQHGHHSVALYAISRQGRELYQEFPIDVGTDRDEVAQKMRDWIDRKHIVRYAFVSESWMAKANTSGAPSQQLDKQEIVMLDAMDKAEPFRHYLGMAFITRPDDDPRKPVLGEFEWSFNNSVGRFSKLFLPLLSEAESPRELANRIGWLSWRSRESRVIAGCLTAVLDAAWNDIEGDSIEAKKESLIDGVSVALSVLIAEYYEEPGKAAQMVKDMVPPQEETKPIDRAPVFPLAVPGYATKRAQKVIGQLLQIFEGEMSARNTDDLKDNILAGLVAAAGQIAHLPNTQERNRMIVGVQDLVASTVKETLLMIKHTEGWTGEDVKAIGGERMDEIPNLSKLN